MKEKKKSPQQPIGMVPYPDLLGWNPRSIGSWALFHEPLNTSASITRACRTPWASTPIPLISLLKTHWTKEKARFHSSSLCSHKQLILKNPNLSFNLNLRTLIPSTLFLPYMLFLSFGIWYYNRFASIPYYFCKKISSFRDADLGFVWMYREFLFYQKLLFLLLMITLCV